ncbi:MAG: 3'-5' exonuclease [Gemmatimonadaceae bacterium]
MNYRTSHQIREQADRLLGAEMTDADGNREDRRHTVSVFNGRHPICTFPSDPEEGAVGDCRGLSRAMAFRHTRSACSSDRRRSTPEQRRPSAPLAWPGVLDNRVEIKPGNVSIATMHLAKGLEFRAVAVVACDDEVLPLQELD